MAGDLLQEVGDGAAAAGSHALPRQAAPEISVIIPCRNGAAHLGQQLDALASQETAFAWELVVVDNGSTDGSVSVAQSYMDRIRLRIVPAPDDANAAYARNVGTRAALADKLVYLDADDEACPGFLASMHDMLQVSDFVTSPIDITALNPPWAQHAHDVPVSTHRVPPFPPLARGCAVGITRKVLESVGGWPEDYRGGEDLTLSYRLQQVGVPLAYLPAPLVRYRFRTSLPALYRQTHAWGYWQVLTHLEFGSRVMPRRHKKEVLEEWRSATRLLLHARNKADLAQSAVRLGYCVGRLRGSLRFKTLYL